MCAAHAAEVTGNVPKHLGAHEALWREYLAQCVAWAKVQRSPPPGVSAATTTVQLTLNELGVRAVKKRKGREARVPYPPLPPL